MPSAVKGQLPLSKKAIRSRIESLSNSMPGINLADSFIGSVGEYDLVWAVQLLDGFSMPLTQTLFKQYMRRRKGGTARKARDANEWLRERVGWIRSLVQAVPVDAQQLRDDDGRKRVANQFANQTAAIWKNIEQSANAGELDLMETWEAIKQPADQWGFIGKIPKFQTKEARDNWILSVMVRLLSAKWWEKRVNRCWDRLQEHIAILLGKVRKGVSAYVSNATMKVVRERKRAMMRWLAESEVMNSQHDLVISMKDCWEASVSNPINRRKEMMTRMRGFEDYAEEQGHVGVFFTWTAPSRFHAWKTGRNGKTVDNDKYDGTTPRETCAYLAKLWSLTRASLKRNDLPVYGFRVCEPHHDGTPHWHMLLFMRPRDRNKVISTLQYYALHDDKIELVRSTPEAASFTDITPRFDWKIVDPDKGDATGYLAAYIAKNIDGEHVDGDDESGTPADVGAQHACAWASWWGIRTFQQIGGAPVGVWRELRRISNAKKNGDLVGPPKPVLQDPRFEAARYAADNGIFRCYLQAMGGAMATRAEHPIKLAHLIEEQANSYGEDIKRLMGLQSARLGVRTRLTGWEVVPAGTYEAAKAAGGSSWGVGVKTGDSPAPWSSDNNCTQPDPDAYADQLMAEQWGLSPFSISRLRSGASVSVDGFSLWLENGQVQSGRAIPSEPDWQPEGQRPAELGQPDEYALPEGDEDWPMLVELCGKVYQAQGHAGAFRWIEMLPEPYQSHMWAELEKLDTPEWLQEQNDYSEQAWEE
ncbi:TPA: replication endonuclease [Aeromonas veronii]|nr:replication endonuclease [Aeromonas veronii]HDO1335415.1 replication endonuclease [Aeromonas veronii]HDO1339844.1 replication endonuclease [Aeromonas veronii]HDO1344285.1 replication endonuclease [Aeromonas veronii]HDO1348875.1 replication endonuclease [Aeromonas veronii]